MNVIDCLEVRNAILDAVKKEVSSIKNLYDKTPSLVVIQVGDNPASTTYIKNKVKTCDEVGIDSNVIKLPEYSTVRDVKKYIAMCNESPYCNAVLLQLPLPECLRHAEEYLTNCIRPDKDVDGLTRENVGKLWTGSKGIAPCTPKAVMALLPADLGGKVVTVLGRSNLVGKPLIKLLQDRNATIISCHSKSGAGNINMALQSSDILITAIGQPKWVKAWDLQVHDEDGMHMRCKTIIDVGINRDGNGKLCGDVDMKTFEGTDVNITPVPNGVGSLTTAQLMLNTIDCFRLQNLVFTTT